MGEVHHYFHFSSLTIFISFLAWCIQPQWRGRYRGGGTTREAACTAKWKHQYAGLI